MPVGSLVVKIKQQVSILKDVNFKPLSTHVKFVSPCSKKAYDLKRAEKGNCFLRFLKSKTLEKSGRQKTAIKVEKKEIISI